MNFISSINIQGGIIMKDWLRIGFATSAWWLTEEREKQLWRKRCFITPEYLRGSEESKTVPPLQITILRKSKRKSSISTSICPCQWKDHKINVIDTPGYFDFVGEVKQGIRVADGAVILVSAKSGVAVGTEKAWARARERKIPVIFSWIKWMMKMQTSSELWNNWLRPSGKTWLPFKSPSLKIPSLPDMWIS